MSRAVLAHPGRRRWACSASPPAASPTTAGRATWPTTSASQLADQKAPAQAASSVGPKVYFLSQAPERPGPPAAGRPQREQHARRPC